MNYITGVSSNFYSGEYFNALEQFEYQTQYDDTLAFIMESYDILLEYESVEYNNTKKAGILKRLSQKVKGNKEQQLTKGQAFLQRIKEYFKAAIKLIATIAQKFMDKVDELFKINQKFIEERAFYVLGIKDADFWDNLKITIFDYNSRNLQQSPYADFHIPELDAKNDATKKIYNTKWDEDQFEKAYFSKILKFKGEKDSFKEAAKKYYRNIQGSDAKPIELAGAKAKDKIVKCYAYVKNYKQTTAKRIRDQLSKIKGALERVDKDFETDKIMQYVDEALIVSLEADETAPNGSVKAEGLNGDTTVEQKDKEHVGQRIFGRIKKYGNYLLTLHTAQMTVAEEYYFASIHVLKGVVSVAEKKGKIDKEKAAKEDVKDTNATNAKNEAIKRGNSGETVMKAATDKAV